MKYQICHIQTPPNLPEGEERSPFGGLGGQFFSCTLSHSKRKLIKLTAIINTSNNEIQLSNYRARHPVFRMRKQ